MKLEDIKTIREVSEKLYEDYQKSRKELDKSVETFLQSEVMKLIESDEDVYWDLTEITEEIVLKTRVYRNTSLSSLLKEISEALILRREIRVVTPYGNVYVHTDDRIVELYLKFGCLEEFQARHKLSRLERVLRKHLIDLQCEVVRKKEYLQRSERKIQETKQAIANLPK